MEFEFWWLLGIPLVFSLGWLASALNRRTEAREASGLPSSYFKGVNFLLSEQPDKAIDAFLEVASADNSTLELHFALANLFRKKGEVDRAIRVHQFLSQRDQIATQDRERATYELGVDFLRAGILDRAEHAFKSLSGSGLAKEAGVQLLALYEIEKDWEKAIEQALALKREGASISESDIAHFYCEQAQAWMNASRLDLAEKELRNALSTYPDSVRASLLLGELYFKESRPEEALAQWRTAEKQNPWYLALIGDKMWQAFLSLGKEEEGLQELMEYCRKYPSIDLLTVLVSATAHVRGQDEASGLLRTEVRARPSLLGLDKMLEQQLQTPLDPERSEDLNLIRELISKHTQRLERHRCQSCGFQAKKFYWQCPGCAEWDSIVPRKAEELDFYPVSASKAS